MMKAKLFGIQSKPSKDIGINRRNTDILASDILFPNNNDTDFLMPDTQKNLLPPNRRTTTKAIIRPTTSTIQLKSVNPEKQLSNEPEFSLGSKELEIDDDIEFQLECNETKDEATNSEFDNEIFMGTAYIPTLIERQRTRPQTSSETRRHNPITERRLEEKKESYIKIDDNEYNSVADTKISEQKNSMQKSTKVSIIENPIKESEKENKRIKKGPHRYR